MIIINNKEIEFEVAEAYMDAEIKERLHHEIAPCSEQEFVDAYVKAHADKYNGEIFDIN